MSQLPEIPMPLERNQDRIPTVEDVFSHRIDFNPRLWRDRLNGDPDVEAVCERFSATLSRNDLFELGGEIVSAPDDVAAMRRLMIATFMWGYGTKGRVYMWAPKALTNPRLPEVLQGVTRHLLDGDLVHAYRAFSEPHLSGYNWGFFTKYLYFLGAAGPREGWPMPLIFDSRVAFTLNAYVESFDWEPEWPRGAGNRYDYYCRMLEGWVEPLHLERPDQIELFLFDNPPDPAAPQLLDVAAAALRLVKSASDELEGALAKLPADVRAELERRIQT